MTPLRQVTLAHPADVAGWRQAARTLDSAGVAPDGIVWRLADEAPDLFATPPTLLDGSLDRASSARRHVPRDFLKLTNRLLLHSDPERFALAYRLLFRLRAEPRLLAVASDRDVARAATLVKAVRRDMHKMKAFVRFREVTAGDGAPVLIAWFEPDHHILAATAPFFQRRLGALRWSILTPTASAHHDGRRFSLGAGATRSDAPDADALEDLWRTYFGAIFNPARLKVKAMTAEMPKKYWRNLPEARLIRPLIQDAERRAQAMLDASPSQPSAAWRARQRRQR
ncbi:MAG: hypothetical protein Kilf2KO_44890 [Rhodospirillales bacterium]